MPLCQFLGIPNWVIRLLHRYFKYFYSRSISDSSLLLPQSAGSASWGAECGFELSKKTLKPEKKALGKSGFVPVRAKWIIERSNAWMERCKILLKNFERTLVNASAKINVCFIRLMVKRLAA
nr:transposase [Tychonema sp. LEGE 07203]